MSSRPTRVDGFVHAIASGDDIDEAAWGEGDPVLHELKVLYEIGRLGRDVAADEQSADATVGRPPPVSVGTVSGRWAQFHLLDQIGQGMSGTVFRAWDSRLDREVALKLMLADRVDAGATLAEARRLARIRHPHVVSVYGVELVDRCVGTWMELLKGRTLHDLVRTQGPLNAPEAALAGADVCSALAAVHRAGLLHRDVKAQNVFREHGGRIVLMDLGAGREIDVVTPDLAGTPLYMAPELVAGGAATIESDIYSVGVLLFFLTTDAMPVMAQTLVDLKRAHTAGHGNGVRDLRPDLPRAFINIVDRALETNPQRRFSSAGDMERALLDMVSRRTVIDESARRHAFGRFLTGRIPAWAVLLLVVGAAILASFTVNRVGRWLPNDTASPTAGPTNPMRVPSTDQLQIARAFEELASALGSSGRWTEARAKYEEAERVYRITTSPDAPLVAKARMHVAWAQHQAGDLDTAASNYELAVVKFISFHLEPLASATYSALAAVRQTSGRFDAAVTAIDAAIEARATALALPATGAAGLARIGRSAGDIIRLLPTVSVGRDEDGDWLPDLFEVSVGLNPRLRDTNGNGVVDGDEDHDRDGLSNVIEFGLPIDPTGVVVHSGSNDPEWLGFAQPANRRIIGRPVESSDGRAWQVTGFGQSQYYSLLTQAQRSRALQHGWRITTSGVLEQGGAFVDVDLGPAGPRFDLGFELAADGAGLTVQRNTSVVPHAGPVEHISSTRTWSLIELEYDPKSRTADLLVAGRRRPAPPYFGHHQFKESLGFFLGLYQPADADRPASADFSLAMLTIK